MNFDKRRSAGYLANHMARLFASGLAARIRPLGLAPAQFMTLIELWNEDGLTQAALVERLDVEQATMANTLRRMIRDGWIEARPHPADRRAKCLFLTDQAHHVETASIDAARQQNEAALSPLSADERALFLSYMCRVIDGMKKA